MRQYRASTLAKVRAVVKTEDEAFNTDRTYCLYSIDPVTRDAVPVAYASTVKAIRYARRKFRGVMKNVFNNHGLKYKIVKVK